MNAYRLRNGNLMVPRTARTGTGDAAVIGDGMVEVPADSPEALEWEAYYTRAGETMPSAPWEGEADAHDDRR